MRRAFFVLTRPGLPLSLLLFHFSTRPSRSILQPRLKLDGALETVLRQTDRRFTWYTMRIQLERPRERGPE